MRTNYSKHFEVRYWSNNNRTWHNLATRLQSKVVWRWVQCKNQWKPIEQAECKKVLWERDSSRLLPKRDHSLSRRRAIAQRWVLKVTDLLCLNAKLCCFTTESELEVLKEGWTWKKWVVLSDIERAGEFASIWVLLLKLITEIISRWCCSDISNYLLRISIGLIRLRALHCALAFKAMSPFMLFFQV